MAVVDKSRQFGSGKKFASTEPGSDSWWYGGGVTAWNNLEEVFENIPISKREGLTIGVWVNDKIVEYVWHKDTSNNGLVLKKTAIDSPKDLKVTPNYTLPSTTQDIVLEYKGINRNCIATINSGTINSQSIELNRFGSLIHRVNLTSSGTQEDLIFTINNGVLDTVFSNVFTIVNGELFVPNVSDWQNIVNSPSLSTGSVLLSQYGVSQSATWNKEIPVSTDFHLNFTVSNAAINPNPEPQNNVAGGVVGYINIKSAINDSLLFRVLLYRFRSEIIVYDINSNQVSGNVLVDGTTNMNKNISFRWLSNIFYVFVDNNSVPLFTAPDSINNSLTQPIKIDYEVAQGDISNINYVDLSNVQVGDNYNDDYVNQQEKLTIENAIKNVKISDETGIEKYKIDLLAGEKLKFEGFEFNVAEKKIINNNLRYVAVSVSRVLTSLDNNKCLVVQGANVNLEIPSSGLQNDFNCTVTPTSGNNARIILASGVTADENGLEIQAQQMKSIGKLGSTYIIRP